MVKLLEKAERRLGEKLFLKGERCAGPKCAVVRRDYAPGAHGPKGKGRKKRGGSSEFDRLLREKQKIRFIYGLDDREVGRYAKEAAKMHGVFSSVFLRLLESRLDNVVFRLGFAVSRRAARQIVLHGHITVNGKNVNIPSYRLKKGDKIAAKKKSLSSAVFAGLDLRLKKFETPPWLNLDKTKNVGTVLGLPEPETAGFAFDATKIKEFYSR